MTSAIRFETTESVAAGTAIKLLPHVTCPHCWERFAPEQVVWISEHVDLLGDPLLGPERQQRFLPSRFTIDGDAIDCQRHDLPDARMSQVSFTDSPGDAGDGAAVCLDPGLRRVASRTF